MKTRSLAITLLSASLLKAMPPVIGTTSSDVTFSVAGDFNTSSRTFDTLTDSMLSKRSGKVTLLAYVTPW